VHSFTEENYLKAIYKLQETNAEVVATSALAQVMGVHAPSVTDMLKRMAGKKLVTYQKSKGFKLSEKGKKVAVGIIRNHRLWEVFLVQSLGMTWDEVHEIAEELEHIQSDRLIDRLDLFLGHPKFDPHGDPIPNAQGKYTLRAQVPLSELKPGQDGIVIGVREDETSFLKHLNEKGLTLGKAIKVITNDDYDNT